MRPAERSRSWSCCVVAPRGAPLPQTPQINHSIYRLLLNNNRRGGDATLTVRRTIITQVVRLFVHPGLWLTSPRHTVIILS